jgi:hypothetical protein
MVGSERVKQRESERLRICRNEKNGFSAEVLTAGKTMQICLIIALDALKDAVSSCGHLEETTASGGSAQNHRSASGVLG